MRRFILLSASVALAACGPSRTDTMRILAEEQSVSAQKDSLLKDVAQTQAFLGELTQQIGTVRNLKSGRPVSGPGFDLEENLTPAERRARIVSQVREITERLRESESRLEASRRRVAELTGSDASKSKRLAAFDSVVGSFRQILDSQKAQIEDLTEQVRTLTDDNARLTGENARLASTASMVTTERDSLVAEQNTAYYVADTREALAKRHIIERVGGFLGFGRTPVPARNLDPTQFTPIDVRQVSQIELPRPGRRYRVITPQNLAALDTPPDDQGRLSGTLKIRDPQQFWAHAKFMIIVEQ
ncbi:MAG: hypothetical protein ACYC7F_03910 [Gemmatimonadaceae bacterium]